MKHCECKEKVKKFRSYFSSTREMVNEDLISFINNHRADMYTDNIHGFFSRVHRGPWGREPDDFIITQAILCLLYSKKFGECLMSRKYRGDTVISRGFAYRRRKFAPSDFMYHRISNTLPFRYPTINFPRGSYQGDNFYTYVNNVINEYYNQNSPTQQLHYIADRSTNLLPFKRSAKWHKILRDDYFAKFGNFTDWQISNYISETGWKTLEEISNNRASKKVLQLSEEFWRGRSGLMAESLDKIL